MYNSFWNVSVSNQRTGIIIKQLERLGMENQGRAIQLNIQHNPSLMNQFPTSVSLMVASTIDSTISILCEVAFTNDSTGPTGLSSGFYAGKYSAGPINSRHC